MGKIKHFDIVYASESAVFYAGQTVAGKVVLQLKEPTKIKGIKIKCQGELYVNFNDPQSKRKHTERHSYFDHVNTLFAGADEAMAAGTYEYPFSFSFNAPGVLPSSFESQFGHVRYGCTAQLNLPLLRRDQSVRKPFSLVSIVDLNNEPLAFTPAHRQRDCRFTLTDRLLCCVNGGLSATLKLSRCAFVPGEQMLLQAEVTNNSSKRVKRVEAFLQQNVIYSTAKGGKRFVKGEAKIAQLTQGPVKRGEVQLWNELITIPPLPPTRLGGCRQIAVDYLLNFVIYVEQAEDIRLNVPLVIGTVPVHGQTPLSWLPSAAPSPPPIDRQPSAPPLDREYDGPPPTYEECMYSDGGMADTSSMTDHSEIDEQGPSLPYRPLYPTYATLGRPPTSQTMLSTK